MQTNTVIINCSPPYHHDDHQTDLLGIARACQKIWHKKKKPLKNQGLSLIRLPSGASR
jgi:hypothetical protein